jgi:hypothetical protein
MERQRVISEPRTRALAPQASNPKALHCHTAASAAIVDKELYGGLSLTAGVHQRPAQALAFSQALAASLLLIALRWRRR